MSELIQEIEQQKKRPVFLKVLCILTYISTGYGILQGITQFLTGKMSDEEVEVASVQLSKSIGEMRDAGLDSFVHIFEQFQGLIHDSQEHFILVVMLSIATPVLGLLGALQMWQGKKLGFHLYIIYTLLSIGGIYLYATPANVPSLLITIGLIFGGAFVFMYSRNLHWLK